MSWIIIITSRGIEVGAELGSLVSLQQGFKERWHECAIDGLDDGHVFETLEGRDFSPTWKLLLTIYYSLIDMKWYERDLSSR
jgi:hypothetical protein